MIRRNPQESKQLAAERRKREDEAPRLIKEARRLTSLNIDVENGGNRYVWRIVVERAAALFEIACPEPGCTNGGHDLTSSIIQSLKASAEHFQGESVCHGDLGAGQCGRLLKYTSQATYRA